jgi:hypothetical protein
LYVFWCEQLDPDDAGNYVYMRARNFGRRSRRIHAVGPYDFGISLTWLEQARCPPEGAVTRSKMGHSKIFLLLIYFGTKSP